MFGKLIFLLLFGYLLYRLLRGKPRPAPRPRPRVEGEVMVACARCGLHVPVGESLEAEGRRYCCREHLTSDGG